MRYKKTAFILALTFCIPASIQRAQCRTEPIPSFFTSSPRSETRLARDATPARKHRAFLALMKEVTDAANAYAKDHGKKYPTALNDDFKSYFSGGSHGHKPLAAGLAPVNPVTGERQWPVISLCNLPPQAPAASQHTVQARVPVKIAHGPYPPGTLELWSLNSGDSISLCIYDNDGDWLDMARLIRFEEIYKFVEGSSTQLTGVDTF